MPAFTPTERRMMEVLSDGLVHTSQELFDCLSDELQPKGVVRKHMCLLRKKLKPEGYDVLWEFIRGRTRAYRLIRLLANPYNGHK